MRKILPIAIFLLTAFAGYLAYRHLMGSTLLWVGNHPVIVAQSAWVVGDQLIYRVDDEINVVHLGQVRRIVHAHSLSVDDLKARWGHHFPRAQVDGGASPGTGVPGGTWPRAALWLLVALASAAALGAGVRLLRKKTQRSGPAAAEPVERRPEPADSAGPHLAGFQEIADFFLQLYKLQLGAGAETDAGLTPLDDADGRAGCRYELNVRVGESLRSRRMTIHAIGGAGHGKSQCFHVIFDTHLVVKIPPVPILHLPEYLNHLAEERRIADTLTPRKCIVPNVSVILNRVQRQDGTRRPSAQQVEDRHLAEMAESSDFHHCLKINGAFVFFMELSTDVFLSHTLESLHRRDLSAMAAEDAHLSLDCQGFIAKYGEANSSVCFDLQHLFDRFARGLDPVGDDAAAKTDPGENRKRLWFFQRMADPEAPAEVQGFSDAAAAAADALMAHLATEQAQLVRTYRQLVADRVRLLSFRRNRSEIQALVTNLLDLLADLGRRQVAVRDLKPDNLLVSGDPERYPAFLASPKEFTIGLIDLETAVTWSQAGSGGCPQPSLGGTPSYATPSHFFPNSLLAIFHRDVSLMLHLQDGYAVSAIIFEVVTGQRLFQRTARLFPGVLRAIARAKQREIPPAEVYPEVNAHFWRTARAEFEERTEAFAEPLGAILTPVPKPLVEQLQALAVTQTRALDQQLRKVLDDQQVVRDPQKVAQLAACSRAAIQRTLDRYRGADTESARGLLPVLERLAELKQRRERLAAAAEGVSAARGGTAVGAVIHGMFTLVAEAMAVAPGPVAQAGLRSYALLDEDPMTDTDAGRLHLTHIVKPD